jgi:hypothetical protein
MGSGFANRGAPNLERLAEPNAQFGQLKLTISPHPGQMRTILCWVFVFV